MSGQALAWWRWLDVSEPEAAIALLLGVALAILASRRSWRRARRPSLLLGPWILLAFVLSLEASLLRNAWGQQLLGASITSQRPVAQLPEAAIGVAAAIAVAFGLGLALANLRYGELPHRVAGIAFTSVFSGFTLVLFAGWARGVASFASTGMLSVHYPWEAGVALALLIAVPLLILEPGALRRRRAAGRLRIRCGYDLRGTRGTTCPECGTAQPSPPADAA